MLPMQEIVTRLKAMSLLELERVAYETRVRVSTLRAIREERTRSPLLKTALPVSEWLERHSDQ